MNYNKVNNKERVIEIFNLIKKEVHKGKNIGLKKWGNPAGAYKNDTYELINGIDTIWVNLITWTNSATNKENRKAIGVCSPKNDTTSLAPQLDVILPYEYSKKFDTRIYENSYKIQIRKYGEFTVCGKSIKREEFFDYLRKNGYSDYIEIDEDGEKFINIMCIDDEFNYEYMWIHW